MKRVPRKLHILYVQLLQSEQYYLLQQVGLRDISPEHLDQ